jgi:cellulose synthase/poly-beta-1,6-N-acetylglucosamine synthase-like glycosyltransferase
MFMADRNLACVQAALTVDNTADNWLCAMFTAEYAGQFDVFLPALATLRLPLPLGGSSNHFRVSHLSAVGGWDAYNVTEDADLGMRLARFGFRTAVVGTATYEEAPALIWPWLCQRTRWFKGWIQTWLVHMRSPARLIRDVGWPAFVVFQLMVGGNVFAALVHPLFLVRLAIALIGPDGSGDVTVLAGVTVAGGYLASAVIAMVGLARRRLTGAAWALALMPLHWILLSAAAWRALYQFLFAPYRWEKTEHGLARHSRLGAMTQTVRPGHGPSQSRHSGA